LGCAIWDVRFKTEDTGYWILDAGFWIKQLRNSDCGIKAQNPKKELGN
jgi:hypothetical protein